MTEAIVFLRDELSSRLRLSYGVNDDIVCVSNLKQIDGSAVEGLDNKVVLQVAGISSEATRTTGFASRTVADASIIGQQPPVTLSISLLITANCNGDQYSQGLKYISECIRFFHDHAIFSRTSHPKLPDHIDKLEITPLALDMDEQSKLWQGMSGALLPSAMYRLRGILIPAESISTVPPEASGADQISKA